MTRLVLGSASPGRLKVLRQAGIDPLVLVSGVDEDAVAAGLGPAAAPKQVVCALAEAKAQQVAAKLASLNNSVAADCVVIGCDSMLYVGGRLCGKPQSVAEARQLWVSMAGRAGILYTGHSVIRLLDHEIAFSGSEPSSTTVHFGRPPAADSGGVSGQWRVAASSWRIHSGRPRRLVHRGCRRRPVGRGGDRIAVDAHVVGPSRAVHRRAVGGQSGHPQLSRRRMRIKPTQEV